LPAEIRPPSGRSAHQGLPPERSTSTAAGVIRRLTAFNLKPVAQDAAAAWGIAAVLGGILIWLAKDSPRGNVGPVIVMLAYLAFGLSQRSRNTVRLADSIYFLGFLWTLFALIANLIWRGPRGIGANEVFVIFGYALVTTATGMFLRLLLIQSQRTVADQVVEARDEIDQRVGALVDEFGRAEQALASFRSEVVGSLKLWSETVTKTQSDLSGLYQKTGKDVAEHAARDLRESITRIGQEFRATETAAQALRSGLQTCSREIEATVKDLGGTFTKTRTAMTKRLDAFDSALEGAVRRINSLEITPTAFSTALNRLIEAVAAEAGRLTSVISDVVRELNLRVGALASTLTSGPTTAQVEAGWREAVNALQSVAAKNREFGSATQDTVGALRDVVAEFDAVRTRLGEMRTSISGLDEAVKHLAGAAVTSGQDHMATAGRLSADLQEAAARIESTMGQVIDFMGKRLNEGK
jgi:hypothetical protein